MLALDSVCSLSWQQPPSPPVYSLMVDGGTSLSRLAGMANERHNVGRQQCAANCAPRVVTVHVEPSKLRVRSFTFHAARCSSHANDHRQWERDHSTPEQEKVAWPFHRPTTRTPAAHRQNCPSSRSATRIRPPEDVIKLSDRLLLMLQPPVETLVEELALPAQPFPYQFEGVAFLYSRHAAVLADEMGLGKTMQAITAIRLLRREGQLRHVLLVCPKALVRNWQREFDSWAPELSVVPVEGSPSQRRARWEAENVAVKIANYEVVVRDRCLLTAENPGDDPPLQFDLVVLDEAQRIKNASSLTHKAVCSLARRRSWALTGTPVENGTDDLVGIFGFVVPGLLSAGMKPRTMAKTAGDHILRRTKEQVLRELPPKWFRDAEIQLTPEQQQTYETAEQEGVLRLGQLGQTVTIHHVFELLIRLKQICNFDPATGASAKLERLEADLEEVASSGRKAVVFSQWVETLEELARRLERFHPVEYHGRIRPERREEVIDRFRHDPRCHVLLISYGAGGVGLNLQFAGYVFLFDRWWNPAVEDQAINRLHRIGAQGPVTVTRFLTLGTIEERIDQILEEKRRLFQSVLSEAADGCRLGLSHEELFGLFGIAAPPCRNRAA